MTTHVPVAVGDGEGPAATGHYVDEIAVERRCAGDRSVTLYGAEITAAVDLLEQRGLSVAEIGAALGVTGRCIQRWRSGQHTPRTLRGERADEMRTA